MRGSMQDVPVMLESDKDLPVRRAIPRVLALTIVLFLPCAAVPARAQDASPPADEEAMELPPGVAFAVLAQLAPVELPTQPAALVVARITMEPGAEIPPHPHPGTEIAVVEAGSVTIRTFEGPAVLAVRGGAAGAGATPEVAGPGQELTFTAGDVIIVPAGNVSDGRAGDDGASGLIFEFVPQAAEGTPEA